MESAVDALKLAFGIFVFLLGLAILFRMTSLAKETSRILISEADRTTYYDYKNPTELNELMAADGATVDSEGRRIVGLNEIIPVIYRYSQENYGVTIIDTINGKKEIVARFDLDTESMCNSWGQTTVDYTNINDPDPTKRVFTEYMNENVLDVVGATHYEFKFGTTSAVKDDVKALFAKIYGQQRNTYGSDLTEYCYWRVAPGTISRRIDSDLFGTQIYFNTSSGPRTGPNHIPCCDGRFNCQI